MLGYGDGDDAIATGLDEELARGVAELQDLINVQQNRGATHTHTIQAAKSYTSYYQLRELNIYNHSAEENIRKDFKADSISSQT